MPGTGWTKIRRQRKMSLKPSARTGQTRRREPCHARALWKSLEPLPATGRAKILMARRRTRGASKKVIHVHIPLCTSPSSTPRVTRERSRWMTLPNWRKRPSGEREGVPVAQLDDILSEVRDAKSELLHVRELVGVLVRRDESGNCDEEAGQDGKEEG